MIKEKFAAIWYKLKNEQGFLLAELQLSMAAAALLMVMFCSSSVSILQNCQKMLLDMQLQDAGRYMLSMLEKDLAYDSVQITVSKDFRGAAKVGCRTVFGGKSYLYTWENNGLYKQIQTAGTKGKNPLYIPDCKVMDWQVKKLDDKTLLVEFILQKQVRQQKFRRVFYCLNGRIVQDGA